jgi:hypothetical protein
MGRKLTAVKVHKRSKLTGTYKVALLKNPKRRVTEVLRRDFSTSKKTESLGIQRAITDSLRELPRRNSLLSARIKNKN